MANKRKAPPVHPGAILREDVLPALKMTVTDFAKHVGVVRPTMSNLVNENSSVSPDMARRLGVALGNGYQFWMRLQADFDEWQAGQEPMPKIERLNA